MSFDLFWGDWRHSLIGLRRVVRGVMRRIARTQIPVQSRHNLQRLFEQLGGQVFIGRMLRATWVRVWHPDGLQTQHIGKNVVRR